MAVDRSHEHGITPREQQIMDLYESGVPMLRICADLKLGYGTLQNIVYRYNFANIDREMNRIEAAIRSADRAYQRALAGSGGRFA